MKYLIDWETEISPVRPYYHGTQNMWLFMDQDLEYQAKRRIARDNCFRLSEIRIIRMYASNGQE